MHPVAIGGIAEKATIDFIVRDFDTAMLSKHEARLEALAKTVLEKHPQASMEFAVTEQYRNMKEVVSQHPQLVAYAEEAIRRAGLQPKKELIRGGTDGSRLSFMGLPCPNLFTGMQAIHSRHEWIAVSDMQKAVETLVHLSAGMGGKKQPVKHLNQHRQRYVMAQLNRKTIQSLTAYKNIQTPSPEVWELPEKVLQFGTGVLLRGLPDYYINKANNEGVFGGRVVVVKSTGSGSIDEYSRQDNLYTQCIKGVVNGNIQESFIINAAVSRVINANTDWQAVLHCAENPLLQIILSNTTEVGITLHEQDNIQSAPPQSYPGKLLSFLLARYKKFLGSADSGMVIIPTELLVDNGFKLRDIVIELARINNLDAAFIAWLQNDNDWCNSLVDRIVPGALPLADQQQMEQTFGYTDELAIMSEPYNLWAIETKKQSTVALLSFANVERGIIVTPDIHKYRELKLRLLNGTHTLSCGLSFLYHFNTVQAAMKDDVCSHFINHLLFDEMVPCVIDDTVSEEEAKAFATNVISRFSNPFIHHKWLSITMQYTGKIKQRCVPLLLKHYRISAQPPRLMALGFAAFLLFMKPTLTDGVNYYGEHSDERYRIQDDEAKRWYKLWQDNEAAGVVKGALADVDLWGEDLSTLPHFEAKVLMYLRSMMAGNNLKELVFTNG